MDRSPKNIALYREEKYWDDRYTNSIAESEDTHDWLLSFDRVWPLLKESLAPSSDSLTGRDQMRILILGCGNSLLSECLYDENFKNIINIDYSMKVIEMMRERNAQTRPLMRWVKADFREMSEVEKESVDVVIDKASLDAVWCDGGSLWTPSDAVRNDVMRCVDEVLRVLVPGGKFVSISFGQPHFRLPLLNRPSHWKLKFEEIPDTFYHLYQGQKL